MCLMHLKRQVVIIEMHVTAVLFDLARFSHIFVPEIIVLYSGGGLGNLTMK